MILGGGRVWLTGAVAVLSAAPRVPGGNVDIIRQFIHRVPAVVVLSALIPSVAVQMLQIIFCCSVADFCNNVTNFIW